jgi:hypothetical protein
LPLVFFKYSLVEIPVIWSRKTGTALGGGNAPYRPCNCSDAVG